MKNLTNRIVKVLRKSASDIFFSPRYARCEKCDRYGIIKKYNKCYCLHHFEKKDLLDYGLLNDDIILAVHKEICTCDKNIISDLQRR